MAKHTSSLKMERTVANVGCQANSGRCPRRCTILAIPFFNGSNWGGEWLRDDKRWQYGAPPAGNANFAWIQQVVRQWFGTETLAGRVMCGIEVA